MQIFKHLKHFFKLSSRYFKTTSFINKSNKSEPFINATSGQYLEDMYNTWSKDPSSVHSSWDPYFRQSSEVHQQANLHSGSLAPTSAINSKDVNEHLTVQAIIRSYQVRGHLVARTNPLKEMFDINDKNATLSTQLGHLPPEVIRYHSIAPSMLDTVYQLPPSTMIGGTETQLPLKEIIKRLELAYCRHIGVEYMHINDVEECNWIRKKFEVPGAVKLGKQEKILLLSRLAHAVLFEAFLQKKWSSEKRFGIEGCDILIPCIKSIIDETVQEGADTVLLGMPHRGRLNVLANVCEKPLVKIFEQFRSLKSEEKGSGDVKYHLGLHAVTKHPLTNKNIRVILIANPSHLEMVDPVVAGRTRAEQFYKNDKEGKKVLSIVMHGDAAVCGEGIVYETIHLSRHPCFNVGGTIHIVVNNQIGFTTDPQYSRSSPYSTDVARVVNAPIFHVNSDDPESVIYVGKVAAEWRNTFHRDVVIDIVSYRRHGHNEQDEPMFTQPNTYAKIKKMKNVWEKYCVDALKQGTIDEQQIKAQKEEYEKLLDDAYQEGLKETKIQFSDWIDSPWPGFFKNKDQTKCAPTGVSEDILTHIANKFSTPPPDFQIHRALERIFTARRDMVNKRMADWALGEALAFGTLLKEGHHVRLSGEDVERGTFSHRHHVIHHQTKKKTRYTFLQDLYPNQAIYTVCNSPISEYGVLGFEHGFSLTNPNSLVIWEAQFGDFANNGQAMFDCMIASGETKWVRQCGMVCLLPHCLEGQGPEHSSARPERYLDLCSDDPDYLPPDSPDFAVNQLSEINWIVANCTLPANFFHIIRRQLKLPFRYCYNLAHDYVKVLKETEHFALLEIGDTTIAVAETVKGTRKPLMLMTPKSLLRLPDARSSFDEMKEGTEFLRVIPASGPASQNPENVKKVIFCSGKVYFEFVKLVQDKKLEDKIAITRVEQLCPFPYDLIRKECKKYKNARITWGQEEHKNSGGWMYVHRRFETALQGERDITYVGRPPSASTASGNKIQYEREHKNLMDNAIKL